MLRDELQDAAVSAARSYCHETVEKRHVLYAIARRFRDRPEVAAVYEKTKAALDPRGSAIARPSLGVEAGAALESISDDRSAIDLLLGHSATGPLGHSGVARQSKEAVAVEPKGDTKKLGPEKIDDILRELDALVGLAAVKSQVRSVLAVVQANEVRAKAGKATVNPSLHLVFTGPPGTGKTTVARIIARLYAAAGALPGAGFTEASRADLVAGYVGQTAIKTVEVINRTKPGVLFIDEAYALAGASAVDFGGEAIATLVKAMEDNRRELAIIVAGYADEMTNFIESNPGLRSRFKTYVAFPDYAPGELSLIFERLAAESGIALEQGVMERATAILEQACERPDFGNARFVRSMFEQAYARMAGRAASDGRVSLSELQTIVPDDLEDDLDTLARVQRRIGFGPN